MVESPIGASPLNLPSSISSRAEKGRLTLAWPLTMILARTFIFFVVGIIMIAGLSLAGSPDPWKESVPYWTLVVVISNFICIPLLQWLARREGISLGAIIDFQPAMVKKDLLSALKMVIPAYVTGMLGLYGTAYLIWGTMPPAEMLEAPPLLVAITVAILLPITNAMAETTTYMGYSLPRLEALTKSPWIALLLPAIGLSIQHAAAPLTLDPKFILWRLINFLPCALYVAWAYRRGRRMMPLIFVHGLMDLQLILTMFFM